MKMVNEMVTVHDTLSPADKHFLKTYFIFFNNKVGTFH